MQKNPKSPATDLLIRNNASISAASIQNPPRSSVSPHENTHVTAPEPAKSYDSSMKYPNETSTGKIFATPGCSVSLRLPDSFHRLTRYRAAGKRHAASTRRGERPTQHGHNTSRHGSPLLRKLLQAALRSNLWMVRRPIFPECRTPDHVHQVAYGVSGRKPCPMIGRKAMAARLFPSGGVSPFFHAVFGISTALVYVVNLCASRFKPVAIIRARGENSPIRRLILSVTLRGLIRFTAR